MTKRKTRRRSNMNIEMVKEGLLWCSVINIAGLLLWGIMFALLHDWIYKVHSKWFKFSVSTFDSVHYAGMAFYKLLIFVFNLVPYVALLIITK
jgi:hypothetical protein